ncbi:hypothetical protein GLOIN_2v1868421 [Rhizophagus clarus]|uniref:BTB domain-containing protein n=1 Tax=Rhizophagus clarus TaxID=94130 RepID=A0A8H3QVJ8_9GLOM|nr:hypothetical protein GLOIN_2v1868421 [Rhizophagus clarus]
MSTQFFSKLSKNYIELLKEDEYYDITIEVGEDPNVKVFRAHMNILCYRSPYLKRTLASNKKNYDNRLVHIKLPRISSDIFQIILEYIYGGILSLNDQNILDIINILIAADLLRLQELVDYLQSYLIENNLKWTEQYFVFIQHISSQSNNLLELQEFCTYLMAKSPDKLLKSFDFTSLSEKSLISLIKRDDLQMKEIEVWEYVLKWGLAQNPTLISDPGTWSDNDFVIMKITLQRCLPLVRFFSLSSKEFSRKVRPYQKLLNNQLYEDLLNFHLDPEIVTTHNILRPRKAVQFNNAAQIIDSRIVNSSIVSTVSRWIDKIIIDDDNVNKLYLPYKFELLLRGSRDGFTPKRFHVLCDDKPNTVIFIKVNGTKEILGGYNPIIWKSHGSSLGDKVKDSFIFSFKNNNVKSAIISNVQNKDKAFHYSINHGPHFGSDIILYSTKGEFSDYDYIRCRKYYYERNIRDTEKQFSIEEYEIFQITKR